MAHALPFPDASQAQAPDGDRSSPWHRSGTNTDQLKLIHSSPPPRFSPAQDASSQPHTPLTPPLTPASSSNANIDDNQTISPESLSLSFSSRLSLSRSSTCTIEFSQHADPEKTPQPDADTQSEPPSSRFLIVAGVPTDTPPAELKSALEPCGEIRSVFVRFLTVRGIVILSFHDTRVAAHAKLQLQTQTFLGCHRFHTQYISPFELQKLIGDSTVVSETRGDIVITVEGGRTEETSLQRLFGGFGDLCSFRKADVPQQQTFHAEYYDCRSAASAFGSLNHRSILGVRLRLVLTHPETPISSSSVPFPHQSSPSVQPRIRQLSHLSSAPTSPLSPTHLSLPQESNSSPFHNAIPLPFPQETNSSPFHSQVPLPPLMTSSAGRRISTGSVNALPLSLHQSTSEQDLRRKAAAQASAEMTCDPHSRRTSNTYGFDAVRKTQDLGHGRPRAISESSASPPPMNDAGLPDGMNGHQGFEQHDNAAGGLAPYSTPFEDPDATLVWPSGSYPNDISSVPTAAGIGSYAMSPSYWPGNVSSPFVQSMTPIPAQSQYSPYMTNADPYLSRRLAHAHAYPVGAMTLPLSPPSHHPHRHLPHTYPLAQQHPHPHHLPASARGAVDITREPLPEKNQIDLQRIASGLDTRTTVMIKNIPNKLSDRELIEYIGKVCPRRIDFLYLRMDFQNGCNVGYAFVNFIAVQDLLHFAKARLGVKWNMFSSEKVLHMSYANYQGKEALVEKFKNSCVMDEQEAWRPKIFFSSGSRQGLPEPFPAPTHLRRKERSSQNRGALFVPGTGYGTAGVGAGMGRSYHSGPGSGYASGNGNGTAHRGERQQGSGLFHAQGRGHAARY